MSKKTLFAVLTSPFSSKFSRRCFSSKAKTTWIATTAAAYCPAGQLLCNATQTHIVRLSISIQLQRWHKTVQCHSKTRTSDLDIKGARRNCEFKVAHCQINSPHGWQILHSCIVFFIICSNFLDMDCDATSSTHAMQPIRNDLPCCMPATTVRVPAPPP